MIIRRRHAEANLVGDDEGDGDSEIDDSEMYEFQEDRHGNNVRVRRLVVASDSDDLEDEGEPEVEYDDLDADYTGENIEFDQAFHARIDGRRPEGDVDWWNEAGDETWFCTDKNIQGSNPESEHWPFPTYSHAMLYGWLTSGGCPITQAQLDRLLVLLQDPKFKPNEDLAGVCDSRSFFRQSEKLLPIVKRASETVPSKVVTKVLVQKTGHAAGGQQVRVVKRELAGTRRIEGVSITSHIKRAFATPSLRRKLLTTAYDDPGDNPPTQFNQTPFCREPKKYTNLRSFHHRLPAEFGEAQGTLQEFHIDDVVRLASGKVMRIDDLCYRAPNLHGERSAAASARGIDVFPALVASGPLFRPSLDGAEYTCAYDTVIQSQVSDIISKVQVCGPGGGAGIVVNSQTCADGIRSAYVPKRTPLGLPGGGGCYLWIGVYIDAMGTAAKHAKSTEGIYLQICSVDRSIYGTRDTIFTLKLLPKGADLDAALESIRVELAQLSQDGIEVYDVEADGIVTVRCGVASLPADHVQAVVSCRGLGNAALISGRGCRLPAGRYGDADVDCREHALRRRVEQTDTVVATMRQELVALQLKKTPMKDMQKAYGTRSLPSPFRGVACDPHVQTWIDASHLIYFGVAPDVCAAIVQGLSGEQRTSLTTRLQQFPWPSGVAPPVLIAKEMVRSGKGATKTGIFGSGVTMDGWRLLLYALQTALDGLADRQHLRLLVDLTRFTARVFTPLTAAACQDLIADCRSIIARGWGRGGLLHDSPKPNTHNLLELVLHTLPALRSAKWGDCRPLETHHQEHKSTMAGRRGGRAGDGGASLSLHWYSRKLCIRLLLGGMVWHTREGTRLEMSPALRAARDFRPGREHLPHPVWAAAANLTPRSADVVDGGGWTPCVLGAEQRVGSMEVHLRKEIYNASEHAGVPHVFTESGGVADGCEDAVFRACQMLISSSDGRHPRVRVGDDLACTFNGEPAWFTLRRMLAVVKGGEMRIWMWPEWWWAVTGRDGQQQKHPVRHTQLVQRASPEEVAQVEEWFPLQPGQVHCQVSVVHSCKREGGTVARAVPLCSVVTTCPAHDVAHTGINAGCPHHGCYVKGRRVDKHAAANTYFEVFDRPCGYGGATHKTRSAAEWLVNP